MNSPGSSRPAGRVLPAHQRLDAGEPLGCAARRSAGSAGPARASRSAPRKRLLELDPLDHRGVHLRLEDLLLALALGLRAVEREVGVAQQVVGLAAADRDPDAGADVDLAALDLERLVHRLEDPVGDPRDARARRRPRAGRRTRRRRSAPRCRRRGCSESAGRAASRSSSSPAAWPSVSLTFLNVSRSTNSTAARVAERAARASACSRRSISSWRFGSPVSESWKRLVDRVLDGLRVGEREARVLGEGDQHLALGLRVGATGLVGGDDEAADDLAVLAHRRGERGADPVGGERLPGCARQRRSPRPRPARPSPRPDRRRRARRGCGASSAPSSGLMPAEATRISCSGSSGSSSRRPTVSSPSRSWRRRRSRRGPP